jgi:DnaJ-class molecular chaperone
MICPTCQGTGQYWNELLQELRPCPDCEGKGNLPSVAIERLIEEVRS